MKANSMNIMKKARHIILALLAVGMASCADEEIVSGQNKVVEGIMTDVTLSFSAPTPVNITSRAAIDTEAEYKVHNLYVYVFDKQGNNGRLFKYGTSDLIVDNEKKTNQDATTSGHVSITVPSGEKRIYAVANVGEHAPITSVENAWEDIETVDELKNNIVTLTRTIYRSSGKLLMSGVYVDASSEVGTPEGYCNIPAQSGAALHKIQLVRVDAKVTFNISLAEGATTDKTFTPKRWKMMNIPTKASLFKNDSQGYASTNVNDYWSMDELVNFESASGGKSTFTFYMMENTYATTGLKSYNERELEDKQSGGENYENPKYANAPETGTYAILTGDYYEKYTENGLVKERRADVTYAIHLGYVGSEPNNFECNRNTSYTYNVYVEGVDKIRLEVTSYIEGGGTIEEQPGAEGNIVETDKFYLVDAHYDRARVTFKKDQISGKAGFSVNTPFDNGFYYIEGVEDGGGLINAQPSSEAKDYEWLSFRRHTKSGYSSVYGKNKFMPYEESKVLDVKGLLRELHSGKITGTTDDLFDADNEVVYTIFINEYYYTADPRNSNNRNFSWKDFVNQDNRVMHILCNTNRSEDKESSLTTSSIMISQRSIKTFYNEKAGSGLSTAWGIESVNETGQLTPPSRNPWSTAYTADNGRWNFFQKLPAIKQNFSSNRPEWTSYVSDNYVEDNNGIHNYLASNNRLNKLVYACLQRNRDENGNGRIEASEVKWYPAAINQLTDIWMGKDALPSEAHLYQNGDNVYRRYLSSDGKELYAEEGSSINNYKFAYANSIINASAPSKYDYRCIRNLGMDGVSEDEVPQAYVQHDAGAHTFTLTYMSSQSIRGEGDFQGTEFAVHGELAPENRPFLKFEYKDLESDARVYNWYDLNVEVTKGNSPCAKYNVGGETGWRLPNQRELALMAAWCNTGWNGHIYCQTRTKASDFLTGKVNLGHSGGRDNGKPFMTIPALSFKGPVRCVRDIK